MTPNQVRTEKTRPPGYKQCRTNSDQSTLTQLIPKLILDATARLNPERHDHPVIL